MKRLLLLAIAVVLLAASSCKKEDIPYITPELTSVTVNADGENVSIVVNSNVDWKVESSMYWAKTKRNQENGTVDIYVSKNSETNDRAAVITLYSIESEETKAVINITQLQKNAIAIDGSSSLELESGEQTFSITLKTNVKYDITISEDCTWISQVFPSKAMQSVNCEFSVAANLSMKEREAQIVFSAKNCQDIKVNVTQRGRPQSLKFTATAEGQISAPVLETEDTDVKILWSGQMSYFYNGMVLNIESSPAEVEIRAHKLSALSFNNIIGIGAIDFSGLY